LAWAFPNYSHHRQQWFRINQQESISPTNYYHLDKDKNMIKILIYLTDVNDQDGPFRYVRGSNLWNKSICTFALHYGIDFKVNKFLIGEESDFKNNIFTKRTDILSEFPDAFIGSTHFGDFLKKDSDISKILLNESVVFTRKKGTMIIFDGGMGVHSGGNANGGERLAIQVAYRKKLKKKRYIFKETKELVRKIKHKVISLR
jgi:ectoine hydroxylase-related dioxygenase (phytanoyl-CoA dioxygenase family)